MARPVPPRIHEHEVFIPGLDPRHDGVRIAQLSDIHVGRLTPASHIRAAIDAANAAKPDLVVLTGDYVCWRRSEVVMAREQLAGLSAPRVLAVLGNVERRGRFQVPDGYRAMNDREALKVMIQP